MQKYLGFSKYHVIVLVIYALITPLLLSFSSSTLNYSFTYDHIGLAAFICISTLIVFYLFLKPQITHNNSLRFTSILMAIVYGIVFAFPEEIIFRGILQGYIQTHLGFTLGIIFASAIFGIAHFLNDTKGFHPSRWNWKLAMLAGITGVPLGIVFALTHSLLLPTILHAFLVFNMKLFL